MNWSSPNFLQLSKLSVTQKFSPEPKMTTNGIVLVQQPHGAVWCLQIDWSVKVYLLGAAPPPSHNLPLWKGGEVVQAAGTQRALEAWFCACAARESFCCLNLSKLYLCYLVRNYLSCEMDKLETTEEKCKMPLRRTEYIRKQTNQKERVGWEKDKTKLTLPPWILNYFFVSFDR